MKSTRFAPWIGAVSLWLALLACGVGPQVAPTSPTPGASGAQQATRARAILPATASSLSVTASPAAKATTLPNANATQGTAVTTAPAVKGGTPAVTPRVASPTRSVPSTSTPDPNLIVITENDIAQAVAGGAGEEQGFKIRDLRVRFVDGKMTLSAGELVAGPVQVQNLVMVGRLLAQNGQLRFEADSVSPRGLLTNMLPALADQALSQYASQWYVEDVRIRDGWLELRIR